MKLRLGTTFLVLMALAIQASGYDMIQSRAIGMGRTVLLSRPTATDRINVPTPPQESGTLLFETGYNRRFELSDLDHLFLASAYHWKRVTIGFGASQFGKSDLYAEQLLKGAVTYHRRSVSLTWTLSAMQLQIGNGYGGLRAATFGLGAAVAKPKYIVALAIDNLTRPRLIDNGLQANRSATILAEFRGQTAYSITGRIRWEGAQKPQFGLGQMIRLSSRSSFFWGLATEPLEYGGGLEVEIPIGSISYAASVHPVLGLSHTVSLVYRPGRRDSKDEDEF